MQSLQLRGPFAAGSTRKITLTNVYKILQIGVEHVHSTPIARYYLNNDRNIKIHLIIDGERYTICDNDILEHDGLYTSTVTIQFPQRLDEYTIIDLAFMDVDN